ncbi:helix-turn-helix domain-containing protein [Candidatus Erwinia dacicola]
MMTLETRVEMSVLHRQGMSIRAIARQLSCSRESVRRYIRSPLPVADIRYKPRAPRPCKLDPFKPYILERDIYGPGKHRWNPQLMHVAKKYAFTPNFCRPYRAKTKGKVERFNHYLKNSFIVPLTATFRQAGLVLDVPAANARIGEWLVTVANTRVHGTTGVAPEQRMPRERAALLPLPKVTLALPAPVPVLSQRPVPSESLQHPLATYQALLEVPA